MSGTESILRTWPSHVHLLLATWSLIVSVIPVLRPYLLVCNAHWPIDLQYLSWALVSESVQGTGVETVASEPLGNINKMPG